MVCPSLQPTCSPSSHTSPDPLGSPGPWSFLFSRSGILFCQRSPGCLSFFLYTLDQMAPVMSCLVSLSLFPGFLSLAFITNITVMFSFSYLLSVSPKSMSSTRETLCNKLLYSLLDFQCLLLLLSRFSRVQPTRLPHPWDSPGKNTGVGCHFLLQCMKVKSQSEVTQSCLTPSDPMDCSPPGPSIQGIFQARVLEWVAISMSRTHK